MASSNDEGDIDHLDLLAPFNSNVLEAFASYVNEGRLDMGSRARVSVWLDLWCLARYYDVSALVENLWQVLPALFRNLPTCEMSSCPLKRMSYFTTSSDNISNADNEQKEGVESSSPINNSFLPPLVCLTPLEPRVTRSENAECKAVDCKLFRYCELLCDMVAFGKKHRLMQFVDFALCMSEKDLRSVGHHVGVLCATTAGRKCKCWDCKQLNKGIA